MFHNCFSSIMAGLFQPHETFALSSVPIFIIFIISSQYDQFIFFKKYDLCIEIISPYFDLICLDMPWYSYSSIPLKSDTSTCFIIIQCKRAINFRANMVRKGLVLHQSHLESPIMAMEKLSMWIFSDTAALILISLCHHSLTMIMSSLEIMKWSMWKCDLYVLK